MPKLSRTSSKSSINQKVKRDPKTLGLDLIALLLKADNLPEDSILTKIINENPDLLTTKKHEKLLLILLCLELKYSFRYNPSIKAAWAELGFTQVYAGELEKYLLAQDIVIHKPNLFSNNLGRGRDKNLFHQIQYQYFKRIDDNYKQAYQNKANSVIDNTPALIETVGNILGQSQVASLLQPEERKNIDARFKEKAKRLVGTIIDVAYFPNLMSLRYGAHQFAALIGQGGIGTGRDLTAYQMILAFSQLINKKIELDAHDLEDQYYQENRPSSDIKENAFNDAKAQNQFIIDAYQHLLNDIAGKFRQDITARESQQILEDFHAGFYGLLDKIYSSEKQVTPEAEEKLSRMQKEVKNLKKALHRYAEENNLEKCIVNTVKHANHNNLPLHLYSKSEKNYSYIKAVKLVHGKPERKQYLKPIIKLLKEYGFDTFIPRIENEDPEKLVTLLVDIFDFIKQVECYRGYDKFDLDRKLLYPLANHINTLVSKCVPENTTEENTLTGNDKVINIQTLPNYVNPERLPEEARRNFEICRLDEELYYEYKIEKGLLRELSERGRFKAALILKAYNQEDESLLTGNIDPKTLFKNICNNTSLSENAKSELIYALASVLNSEYVEQLQEKSKNKNTHIDFSQKLPITITKKLSSKNQTRTSGDVFVLSSPLQSHPHIDLDNEKIKSRKQKGKGKMGSLLVAGHLLVSETALLIYFIANLKMPVITGVAAAAGAIVNFNSGYHESYSIYKLLSQIGLLNDEYGRPLSKLKKGSILASVSVAAVLGAAFSFLCYVALPAALATMSLAFPPLLVAEISFGIGIFITTVYTIVFRDLIQNGFFKKIGEAIKNEFILPHFSKRPAAEQIAHCTKIAIYSVLLSGLGVLAIAFGPISYFFFKQQAITAIKALHHGIAAIANNIGIIVGAVAGFSNVFFGIMKNTHTSSAWTQVLKERVDNIISSPLKTIKAAFSSMAKKEFWQKLGTSITHTGLKYLSYFTVYSNSVPTGIGFTHTHLPLHTGLATGVTLTGGIFNSSDFHTDNAAKTTGSESAQTNEIKMETGQNSYRNFWSRENTSEFKKSAWEKTGYVVKTAGKFAGYSLYALGLGVTAVVGTAGKLLFKTVGGVIGLAALTVGLPIWGASKIAETIKAKGKLSNVDLKVDEAAKIEKNSSQTMSVTQPKTEPMKPGNTYTATQRLLDKEKTCAQPEQKEPNIPNKGSQSNTNSVICDRGQFFHGLTQKDGDSSDKLDDIQCEKIKPL